jgi:hypothetical protein
MCDIKKTQLIFHCLCAILFNALAVRAFLSILFRRVAELFCQFYSGDPHSSKFVPRAHSAIVKLTPLWPHTIKTYTIHQQRQFSRWYIFACQEQVKQVRGAGVQKPQARNHALEASVRYWMWWLTSNNTTALCRQPHTVHSVHVHKGGTDPDAVLNDG